MSISKAKVLISKFKVGVFFQQDVDLGDNEITFGTESAVSIVLDNEGIAGADGGCGMS